MYKLVSEMTDADKAKFLKETKESFTKQFGIPWEVLEEKIQKEMDDTFDDEKFAKMDPAAHAEAAYTRKAFGDKKPELVDYIIWQCASARYHE